MSTPPRVVAVIACLDPPVALVEEVREVLRQAGQVVVVDDGSDSATRVFVELEAVGVVVIHQANAGIAAALNTGIRWARGQGADTVLTLDQDSRLGGGYVAAALAALDAARLAGIPVAFVSAESYSGRRAPTDGWATGGGASTAPPLDSESGYLTPRARRVNLPDSESSAPEQATFRGPVRLARAFDPMQSGWVVPLTTFERVGPLEEDLVIDGVDSEFTVRCRAAGLHPVIGPGCVLEHGQGERMPARLLGRPVVVRGAPVAYNRHPPTRVYYMARNGTILTRRHLLGQPRWVLRRLGQEAQAHGLRLAFDPQRGRLVVAVLAGWRDGLRGRTGRIPADLGRRLRSP